MNIEYCSREHEENPPIRVITPDESKLRAERVSQSRDHERRRYASDDHVS